MRITEHHTEEQLQALAKSQNDARLRVQLQAIVLAKQKRPAPDIAKALGHGRRTVQQWVHDYNAGSIEGLGDKRGGNHRYLTQEQEQQLRQRLDAGATEDDGVCSLRAADVRAIVEKEFGKIYKPSGSYDLLHRLGYSYLCLDHGIPKATLQPRKLLKNIGGQIEQIQKDHPDKQVNTYFQDEARFGQQGTLTRVWARTGSRPTAVRQTQYDYLWA